VINPCEVSEKGREAEESRVSQKNVYAIGNEIYIERGGAGGRAIDYCLQAAAELGRLLARERHAKEEWKKWIVRQREVGGQSCRRSSKVETETRKKLQRARR
jgi:hypothetical protein